MRKRWPIVLFALAGCGRIVGIHDFASGDGGLSVDGAARDVYRDTKHDSSGDEARAVDANGSPVDGPVDVPATADAGHVPIDACVDVVCVDAIGTEADASPDGNAGDVWPDGELGDASLDESASDTSPDAKACPPLAWQWATTSILSNIGRGACGFDPATLPTLVAAIDEKGFDQARGCGVCLRLVPGRTDVIAKFVDVLVIDRAGDDTSSVRRINISREAMAAIATPGMENVGLNFAPVPCPTTLIAPTVRMMSQQGSSPQHLSVQIRDQALPVSAAEIWFAGAWSTMAFTSYNYWTFDSVGIAPPYTFRLTNNLGDTITISDITLTSTATADGPLTDTREQFPSCIP